MDVRAHEHTRTLVADIDALRRGLKNEEAVLLEEIWRFHVQERQWIPAVELHRRGGGRGRVREVLAGLGGALILHNDWDVEPTYRVWPLGAVICPSGQDGELLLERWLAYQVHLFHAGDVRRSVDSDEVASKLALSD